MYMKKNYLVWAMAAMMCGGATFTSCSDENRKQVERKAERHLRPKRPYAAM